MIQMKRLNPEVYFVDQPIVAIGGAELDFLQREVAETARKRTRLCAHADPEESLHEMFVVYTDATYMRPNWHPKDESLHILKGHADIVLFDDVGNVREVVQVNGDPSSGQPFYCRIPKETYHTVVMRSERLVIHEGLTGPFRVGGTTLFAPWAPEESDAAGIAVFSYRVESEVKRQINRGCRDMLRMSRQSPEVFIAAEPVGKFGAMELEFMRDALPNAPRRRVRVCMHQDPEERFHEMFIMFPKGSYLAPSKHLGKDESVDVIEGQADVVLFDEQGAITDVISCGDRSTGLPFYFRTPHERWHAWIVRSETFVVHEVTEGPFRREDTILAPWSPPDINDSVAVPIYQKQLQAQAARFIADPTA